MGHQDAMIWEGAGTTAFSCVIAASLLASSDQLRASQADMYIHLAKPTHKINFTGQQPAQMFLNRGFIIHNPGQDTTTKNLY